MELSLIMQKQPSAEERFTETDETDVCIKGQDYLVSPSVTLTQACFQVKVHVQRVHRVGRATPEPGSLLVDPPVPAEPHL